jgi:hypothetical protein
VYTLDKCGLPSTVSIMNTATAPLAKVFKVPPPADLLLSPVLCHGCEMPIYRTRTWGPVEVGAGRVHECAAAEEKRDVIARD